MSFSDDLAALDRAQAVAGAASRPRVIATREAPCPQRTSGTWMPDFKANGQACGLCGSGLEVVGASYGSIAGKLGHPGRGGRFLYEYVANDSRTRTKGGRHVYVDCPEHGPVPPAINRQTGNLAFTTDGKGWRGRCGVCGTEAPARAIERRAKRGTPSRPDYTERGGKRYCIGACASGKRTCDCTLCMGRCHGAGVCGGHAG